MDKEFGHKIKMDRKFLKGYTYPNHMEHHTRKTLDAELPYNEMAYLKNVGLLYISNLPFPRLYKIWKTTTLS